MCSATVPPKMLEGLPSSDGVQGTDMHLSCKADGLPAPAFRFYKVHCTHAYHLNSDDIFSLALNLLFPVWTD